MSHSVALRLCTSLYVAGHSYLYLIPRQRLIVRLTAS